MQVAVIGPADATTDEARSAGEVGAALARAGHVVVTGGRGGVMAAATEGASAAGGLTLALLPGSRADDAVARPSVVVPSGLGEARNALVVRAADVVVAVGGGWGTLSEIALACRAGTPVVALDTWRLDDARHRTGSDPIVRVASPRAAVDEVARHGSPTP